MPKDTQQRSGLSAYVRHGILITNLYHIPPLNATQHKLFGVLLFILGFGFAHDKVLL